MQLLQYENKYFFKRKKSKTAEQDRAASSQSEDESQLDTRDVQQEPPASAVHMGMYNPDSFRFLFSKHLTDFVGTLYCDCF